MTDRKQEILDQIRIAIEEVWDNTPFPDIGLDYKIENGIALDKNEKEYFIRSEGWKMETLRGVLPYVLANLVAENPDIAELLAGKHVTAQANRDGNYTKTLLILDEKERFYVDLFYFPPKSATPEHNHNAHCVSFQIIGDLTERERKPLAPNHDEILLVSKTQGSSTIVSPEEFPDDNLDMHAIANNSGKIAVTLHVYSQRVLGDDNKITINRSDAETGPTAVKEAFYSKNKFELSSFVNNRSSGAILA